MPCAARRSAKGSLEPVGIRPTLKQPRSVSSLSAIETSWPASGARNRVFHADRFVLIVDGDGDFFGFALGARVETADDALKFGEFLDEFGGEIGFREQRGALRVGLAAEFVSPTQCHHPLGLLEIAAEFGLEGDVGEIVHAVGELLFLIGVPEEAGVVEAGAQHAFIAVTDQALGIAIGVGDRDELRVRACRPAFPPRSISGDAHHRDQDFFRKIEELRIEGAGDRRGPFGQVDQRVEQIVIAFVLRRDRFGCACGARRAERITKLSRSLSS